MDTKNSNIISGVPWFDQNGETVNAHGGCLIKENNRYYFFGEYKTDEKNCFNGFSCYSSENLTEWRNDGVVLKVQNNGLLGNSRIGERPKVVKCKKTGKFIMFMHTDNLNYSDPVVGVAVCDEIDGEYQLLGAMKYKNDILRRWDIGTFIDDETGYLIFHEGLIMRLADDYLSVDKIVIDQIAPGGESPVIFKKDEYYYFLFSNKTSWERNDNFYLSSKSITGPWVNQGIFCPEGTMTYNSQCTFVFSEKINGINQYMYMGDRWSFPRQKSSGTYVWLPIEASSGKISINKYLDFWNFYDVNKKAHKTSDNKISFLSNKKNNKLEITFDGSRILVTGNTNRHSGYANFLLLDVNNKIIHKSLIDFYSVVPSSGIRYYSPKLSCETHKLIIFSDESHGVWSDKRVEKYGSDGDWLDISGYKFL